MAGFNYYCMGLGMPLVRYRCRVGNKMKAYVIHKLFCIYSIKIIYSFDFLAKLLTMLL